MHFPTHGLDCVGIADMKFADEVAELVASWPSARLAAVASSAIAAFCWVTWSIWLTAVLTCCRPVACSWAPAAISETTSLISATLADDLLQRLAGLGHQLDALARPGRSRSRSAP